MQSSHSKQSDKLNIIDYSTFTQIQQHSNLALYGTTRKVRNSKYRKKHRGAENDFDLLTFIAAKKAPKQRAHHKKRASLIQQTRIFKKNGKTREKQEKKLTRLKKSILRNRELRLVRAGLPNIEPNNQETSLENCLFKQPLLDDESMSVCDQELEDNKAPRENSEKKPQLNISANAFRSPPTSVQSFDHNNAKLGSVTNQINEMSLRDLSPKAFKCIHSRRFREYCDNSTTPDLAEFCKELLSDLDRFQRRAFQKNPIKAKAHRRIVLGFREVQNNLRINKLKLVLIATDCEQCNVEGGIDDTIESIKTECKSSGTPYAFPLQRRQLAYALKKSGNISCVGILDYDGARDKFSELLTSLESARAKYEASVKKTPPHRSRTIN